VHPEPAAAWLTFIETPAIVSAAVLVAVEGFFGTVTVTRLDPVFVGAERATHDASLDQFHVQPAGAVTETVVLPPDAAKLSHVDATLGAHCEPDWVTIEVCPATDRAPLRDVEELFGPTVNAAAPAPLPLALVDGATTQLTPLVRVQPQPAGAAMVAVPDPPAGPNDDGERDTV
jgi:hypothetical protein